MSGCLGVGIDILPERARYGADRHVIGSITEAHFAPESFDVVICVGVLGWGVDTPEDAERAMAQCFDSLRPGGLLIVGWNDANGFRPPSSVDEIDVLSRFDRIALGPFPAATYPTFDRLRLTLEFYEKPAA